MSLILLEGFENYLTPNDALNSIGFFLVNGFSGVTLPTGRDGIGKSFNWSYGTTDIYIYQNINLVTSTTMICGMAISFSSTLRNANYPIIQFMSGTSIQGGVRLNTTSSKLEIFTGVYTTVKASASNPSILIDGGWNYIECKYVVHNSLGLIQVRVNGIDSVSWTGNTNPAATGSVNSIRSYKLYTVGGWDDIYILDNTGSSPFNDFLGPIYLRSLPVVSQGTYKEWSSSFTDHVNAISGPMPNPDNNSNIYTNTVGAKESFRSSQLAEVGDILGFQVTSRSYSPDASGNTFSHFIKDGTSELHSDLIRKTGYKLIKGSTYTTAPDGSALTLNKFNAIEFGVECKTEVW
jgi:hypothetical protein